MDYHFGPLIEGTFVNRDNRFRAEVQLPVGRFKAHVPNSGRMKEILEPGNRIWVKESTNPLRKTPYTLLLVESAGELICLDSHLANTLFEIWLQKGYLREFEDYKQWQREVSYGQSRVDFLLQDTTKGCLVEVKSVNLVINGQGRFPDAPTARGTRHLEELASFKDTGQRAAVVFILMRKDGFSVGPNDQTDPKFGETLRAVINRGVEVYGYKGEITPRGVSFLEQVPIK